jgi:hypothetical protein
MTFTQTEVNVPVDNTITSAKLSGDLVTPGNLDVTGNATFGDNSKAIFGAGSDLQIYHTSTYSAITDVGTGELYIGGDGFVDIGNAALSLTRARFSDSTSALYQQGSIRLATTATGIDVTGSVTADGLTVDTDTLVVDATNNRVGIGTSSPSRKLHVDSGTTDTVALFESSGDAYAYLVVKDSGSSGGAFFGANGTSTIIGTDGSTERMRIDSSGNLLVGKTDSDTLGTAGHELHNSGMVHHTRAAANVLYLNRTGNDGSIQNFYKDGALVGSIGVVSGNNLNIFSAVSGHSGLSFGTGVVYATDNAGDATDNVTDLGSASFRWNDAYITNGVTTGSDGNDKQDIETLSDAEQRVAVACKGLLRKWRWKDAVEAKGDDARIHFGIIAQDLQAAFEAEGLDAGRYAMFMSNTWTDEETGEERTRLGVRYHELLAFIIAAI